MGKISARSCFFTSSIGDLRGWRESCKGGTCLSRGTGPVFIECALSPSLRSDIEEWSRLIGNSHDRRRNGTNERTKANKAWIYAAKVPGQAGPLFKYATPRHRREIQNCTILKCFRFYSLFAQNKREADEKMKKGTRRRRTRRMRNCLSVLSLLVGSCGDDHGHRIDPAAVLL